MGKGNAVHRSASHHRKNRIIVSVLAALFSALSGFMTLTPASADELVCVSIWRETNGVRDYKHDECYVPTPFTGPMGHEICHGIGPNDEICIKWGIKVP